LQSGAIKEGPDLSLTTLAMQQELLAVNK